MADARRRLGPWGESLAATYLGSRGLQILDRGWRCARGEIDLVARDGSVLVFVEVKTRRGRAVGTPEEGLTPAKARKLAELGQLYLAAQDLDVDGPWTWSPSSSTNRASFCAASTCRTSFWGGIRGHGR